MKILDIPFEKLEEKIHQHIAENKLEYYCRSVIFEDGIICGLSAVIECLKDMEDINKHND